MRNIDKYKLPITDQFVCHQKLHYTVLPIITIIAHQPYHNMICDTSIYRDNYIRPY